MNNVEIANAVLVFGVLVSLFYGARAAWIFMYPWPKNPPEQHNISWWCHQVWINFWGSFIGWISIYLLIVSIEGNLKEVPQNITSGHLLLVVVGILGTMGFLPLTAWILANSMAVLTRRIMGVKIEDGEHKK